MEIFKTAIDTRFSENEIHSLRSCTFFPPSAHLTSSFLLPFFRSFILFLFFSCFDILYIFYNCLLNVIASCINSELYFFSLSIFGDNGYTNTCAKLPPPRLCTCIRFRSKLVPVHLIILFPPPSKIASNLFQPTRV